MTSKTSILLIIQQSQGIDYQTLLSKTAPNYKNLNSARAALSRILKDAVSFGIVQKKGHQLYLTDKGVSTLKVKMHDKLVLKLNQLMGIRTVWQNPDALVQHLSILLERSKIDNRLLDNARASVDFTVTDLEKVKEKLEKHISHLQYLEKNLSNQLGSLKEHNFPASKPVTAEEMNPTVVQRLIGFSNANEIQLEHNAFDLSQNKTHPIIQGLETQPKGNRLSIKTNDLVEIIKRLSKQEITFPGIKAYMGLFTLEMGREKIIIKGPSHLLKKTFDSTQIISQPIRSNQTPVTHIPAKLPMIPPDPHPKTPQPNQPYDPIPFIPEDNPEEPEEPEQPQNKEENKP